MTRWRSGSCNQIANPCVFRKVDGSEGEMVVVVHVDDILAHAIDQATMERFAADFGRKFKLKGIGDDKYYTRVPTLSKTNTAQTSGEKEKN